MRSSVWRHAALVFLIVILPMQAFPHHSRAAYGNEQIELVGTVVELQWRNPHILLILEAVNEAGSTENWVIEGGSVYDVQRGGITRDMLAVGQPLTVSGPVSTRKPRAMLGTHFLLSSGQSFSGDLSDVQETYNDAARLVDAASENRGIFRVWSVPAATMGTGGRQLRDQSYTDEAIAARASWDPFNNFTTRCEPEGMPRIMMNPHPFEFIDEGAEIKLRTELYDVVRILHMDRDSPPENAPSSPLGYSVGSWDGDDLVVETTRINWPYFDKIGTPQSEDVRIHERYTLSDDQSRLDFRITVTDPATFTRPAVLTGYWLALGDTIPRYDCVPQNE